MIFLILIIFLLIINIYLFSAFPKACKQENIIYDTCIVLGCPTNDDGTLSISQTRRMKKAVHLYQQGTVKTLLLSGGAVKNEYVEATVMAHYALQNGVAEEDIFLEKEAKNTYDNLCFCSHLCKQHSFEHILVVTSRFHVRRSNFFVKKFFQQYAIVGYDEKDRWFCYVMEYVRMWNTLRYEWKLRHH